MLIRLNILSSIPDTCGAIFIPKSSNPVRNFSTSVLALATVFVRPSMAVAALFVCVIALSNASTLRPPMVLLYSPNACAKAEPSSCKA